MLPIMINKWKKQIIKDYYKIIKTTSNYIKVETVKNPIKSIKTKECYRMLKVHTKEWNN